MKKARRVKKTKSKKDPKSIRAPKGLRSSKDDIWPLACMAVLLSLTFFVCGPIQLFIGNITELWFSMTDMLGVCLLTGLAAAVIIFLAGLLLRGKARAIYIALLLGVSIAFYIQGNYYLTDYGVLDGRDIPWENYTSTAVWNSVLWLVCLAIPFIVQRFCGKGYKKVFQYAACAFIAVQLLSLGMLCARTDFSRYQKADYALSDRDLYTVSAKKNVITIVLDSVETTAMDAVLETEPELLEPYEGFTYFQNMSCSYPTTKGAMSFIVTGQRYENKQPYSEFIEQALSGTDYYTTLADAGYDIGIYTVDMFVSDEAKAQFVSNSVSGETAVSSKAKLEKDMLRFTAFRYFPHIAKKYVVFYSGIFDELRERPDADVDVYNIGLDNDYTFYKELTEKGLNVISDKNKYQLIHLFGAHGPETLDEDLNYLPDGTGTYMGQLKACIKIVGEYLRQLKELGLYDDSLVIVTADHGIEARMSNSPILLVKPFGAEGALKTSDVPVSHANLQATVMDALGFNDGGKYGTPVFDVDPNDPGERRYLKYTWDDSWDADYLPDMPEYYVQPDGSFLQTGRVYTKDGVKEVTPYEYHAGDELLFGTGTGPQGQQYFLSGASHTDVGFMWSEGHSSKACFDMGTAQDLTATIDFKYVANSQQRIAISSNGDLLYEGIVSSPDTTVTFPVPESCFTDGKLILEFEYPDAVLLYALGSGDMRVLSVGFSRIVFNAAK